MNFRGAVHGPSDRVVPRPDPAFALVGSAVLAGAPGLAQPPSDLKLTPLHLPLSTPLVARAPNDGTGRLFFGERNGAILVRRPGAALELFLDLSPLVDPSGEGGLLGLAFHPDFAHNRYFYVSYTADGPGSSPLETVVARYRGARLLPGSRESAQRAHHPEAPPAGAEPQRRRSAFRAGRPSLSRSRRRWRQWRAAQLAGSEHPVGQDVAHRPLRFGGLRRALHGASEQPPYVGVGGRDEIWASGLRNPYRFSFDRDTGDLFIADVGQGSREEVDFQPAASGGGENYGWPCREGDIPGTFSCSGSFTEPVMVYPHAAGDCSITGGYRYRGCIRGLRGTYVFGDYCTARVYFGTQGAGGGWTFNEWADLSGNLFGFGEDEDGELYLLQQSQVFRFDSASDCQPPEIFTDGFESGNTAVWSSAQGG